MTPEIIYVDALLGASAAWTRGKCASNDIKYVRADIADRMYADGYVQGVKHQQQREAAK